MGVSGAWIFKRGAAITDGFLASARSRFFMEPFQFERVDAFALNVGRMNLEKKEPGNV